MHSQSNCQIPTRQGLLEARLAIRHEQEKQPFASGVIRALDGESTLEPALQALEWRKQFQSTKDPNVVRRGLWKFDRATEAERLLIAEELIRRADPGPFEDPAYLALLAYQAASVQMAFAQRPEADRQWSRTLLGTVHAPEVDSFAKLLTGTGYSVILIHSGLMEFIYQSAKAVVSASHPEWSKDPSCDIQSHLSPEVIQDELNRNPEPVRRIYRTLEAYFFHGQPRAFANEAVNVEEVPPLSLLVEMAERFVFAHEYTHCHPSNLDWRWAGAQNEAWAKEFFADTGAMVSTVMSAARLDHVDPVVPLSGAVFALACLQLLADGFLVVCEGKVRSDDGTESHPPSKLRAHELVDNFHSMFDVTYTADWRGFDLSLLAQKRSPETVPELVRSHIQTGAFAWANSLFMIWSRVRRLLLKDFESGRNLHTMWGVPASAR